jgi:hypothetical protein
VGADSALQTRATVPLAYREEAVVDSPRKPI